MSTFSNPRRTSRSRVTPITSSTYRKGATFHSENLFTPPSLPRRSQTSLSEDAVEKKTRLATLTIQNFDRMHNTSPSASRMLQSYRDEGLPFPQGLLHNTIHSAERAYPETMDYKRQEPPSPLNEQEASLRQQRQTRRAREVSDSGLGSSIMSKSSAGGAVTAITMSACPAAHTNLQGMSPHASEVVNKYILQKLLAEASFKDFHPIVRDCPRAIQQREIVCLRDLEKTLTLCAPHRAKTVDLYLEFCFSTILHIRTALTFENLSDQDQIRPQDRLYTPGYFTDLAVQVRQAAAQIASSREKEMKGEELDEKDAKLSDELKLYGGYSDNGRPAELVRMKNGKPFSVMTGEAVNTNNSKSHSVKRMKPSLDEDEEAADSAYRSMARRKKFATAAELAPKRCRELGCDKEFQRACDLTKHEKTHSRPWKCDVPDCRYAKDGWPTEKELLRHKNDRHSKAPKMYSCQFEGCTYKSKRESNSKQHMEKAHGWKYVRSKSNGKKRGSTSGHSTSPDKSFQSPLVGNMNEEYECQEYASVRYEQPMYSPNVPVLPYVNSAYGPEEYCPLPEFSLDIDMDAIPQLHVENVSDSPNSNLRHGSTDSSVPSPYGADNLLGFHIENDRDSYAEYTLNVQVDGDHALINADYQTSHMYPPSEYQQQLPEFSPMACSTNDPVQHFLPGGHGGHVLYTPPSLLNSGECTGDFPAGEDFALFPSERMSHDSNLWNVPLFGPGEMEMSFVSNS